MNRKDFILTGGRIIILGGIAASAGYLIVKKKIDTTCSVSSACEKCSRLSDCDLPQTKEVRDEDK